MSRFIQQSACRGQRPPAPTSRRAVSRPRLTARLLENRRVPRLLVAPVGFGKAQTAFEYAEVTFDFSHVFWIRGSSPCFLRDLDAASIASSVLACDEEAALVVIEDLPTLDDQRARQLMDELRALMAAGCEVVVTLTPARDCLSAALAGALVIGAQEFMVDAEEDAAEGERGSRCMRPLTLDRRIAALRWGEHGLDEVVGGLARDGLEPDRAVVLWTLLALGRGTLSVVEAVVGRRRAQAGWEYAATHYPYAGIDEARGTFETVEVPVEALRRGVGVRLASFAEACGRKTADGLVTEVADRALSLGYARRGGRLMAALASREACARWLERHGWSLVADRAAAEVCDLYDMVSHLRVEQRPAVNAMLAWAWAQRGNRAQVAESARRVRNSPQATPLARAAAALALWDQGNAAAREQAEGDLAAWMATLPHPEDAAPVERLAASVASVVLCRRLEEEPLFRWAQWAPDASWWGEGERNELELALYGAALGLEAIEEDGGFRQRPFELSHAGGALLLRLAASCTRALETLADRGYGLGLGALRAATALERVAEPLAMAGVAALSPRIESELQAAWADEGRRRGARTPVRRLTGVRSAPIQWSDRPARWMPLDGAPRGRGAGHTAEAPLLELRLFGSFEVHRADQDLTAAFRTRKKVRLLLALLVLHRERELTRERLAAMLWPTTNPRTATKNFYKLWRELWEVLSLDGACPYLVRDCYGCRLESSLFVSDVEQFERLNRQLLFGASERGGGWEAMLFQVQESFSAPLMPSEMRNEVVIGFRERFAANLVDGLLAASARLLAEGESQGALWFAREAHLRDGTREDGFAALMRAQMASDQRRAAIETYFACRDYLSDALGLDPSPAMAELYQSLVEGNHLVV